MNLQIFLKASMVGAASSGMLPSLARLLSVARREWLSMPVDELLCEKFSISRQAEMPLAAISQFGEGMGEAGVFSLMARPVHLMLQRDDFVLYNPAALALTPEEADAIISSINGHFQSDGFTFIRSKASASNWYVQAKSAQSLTTTHLLRAAGRNIGKLLPQGRDAARWHGVLNELQMLLHEHPVNLSREARGGVSVNSVWLYGGGQRPTSARTTSMQVLADDPLVKGLAGLAGDAVADVPDTASTFLNRPGDVLAVIDNNDWQAVEQGWFVPALTALRRSRIKHLHVYLDAEGNTLHALVRPVDLYKFWHKTQPIEAYLHG